MNVGSLTMPRTPTAERTPSWLHHVILFWLFGTAIGGKAFAYLHVGPLYITELVLVCLMGAQYKRISVWDGLYALVLIGYVMAANILYPDASLTLIGKDLSWMYYLYFLKFFPFDFPRRYYPYVIFSATVGIFAAVTGVLAGEKYRTAATMVFLALYTLRKNSMDNWVKLSIVLLLGAIVLNFKTAMAMSLVFPFLMLGRKWIARILSLHFLLGMSFLLLMITAMGWIQPLLVGMVNLVGVILSFLGKTEMLSAGTAVWRTNIWERCVEILTQRYAIFFGFLPGINFMSNEILGPGFNLAGGEELGVVRSVHNILVQIFLKTGLVGLVVWLVALTGYLKRVTHNEVKVFFFICFMFALTADVFEVPSRGPLIFCYCMILQDVFERRRQANLPQERRAVARQGIPYDSIRENYL